MTKPRKFDRKKGKSSRNVFLTFVCGAAGSGKTSLLRNFAGKPYLDIYHPTEKPISVVNSVDIDGSEKYLVVGYRNKPEPLFLTFFQLQEFGSSFEAETLRNSKKIDLADVIVYVHDSSDTNSFSYISNLRVSVLGAARMADDLIEDNQQQYNLDHIPTLFVATKSDLDLAQQVSDRTDWYPLSNK